MGPTFFFLAGIGNSEPDHWQSLFRARVERGVWVEHEDWRNPRCDAWLRDLERAWSRHEGQKIVVAHSLGCLLFAEWCTRRKVEGVRAMLVAVPDVESPAFPREAEGFRSAFALRVPRGSRMVASRDDRYATYAYACDVARHWDIELVDAGAKGHINACSYLGTWEDGWRLLEGLAAGPSAVVPSM
jgi:predicted alpha/beta hydrolase family esterase